jgi:ACS family hexuronate transporter-like MFS transporter
MLLVSFVSYVDRGTLALLAPTILAETKLNNVQYSWMIAGFSIAYTLGNPLWGRVLDRVGIFAGMLVAVALWSAASAAHALAGGLGGFVVARVLLGVGEGATFPGGLGTASQTLPPDRRARGIAVAYSGGSLGAIATALVITPIALRWGWRGAFVATGMMGGLWLVIWTLVGRRIPPPAPADPRLWAFMAAYALGAMPLALILYAAPIYLHQRFGLTQAQLGRWLWAPPVGWEIGYFVWGWVTDRIHRADGDGRHGGAGAQRALFAALALGSLPLLLVPSLGRFELVLAQLCAAMFVAAGFVIASLAYATRAFGIGHAGYIAGLGAGSWSALVALVMPLIGRWLDAHAYAHAFQLVALAPLAAVTLWTALDGAARTPRR